MYVLVCCGVGVGHGGVSRPAAMVADSSGEYNKIVATSITTLSLLRVACILWCWLLLTMDVFYHQIHPNTRVLVTGTIPNL